MEGAPGGMANGIVGTLVLLLVAFTIGIPIGMLAGIYLAEYGTERWLAGPVRFLSDVLAGVPSIVVGILGYELLVVPLGRHNGWSGAMALAFIMIPIVARTTEEMLLLVPNSYREASIALGATKARTILRVILPAATGSVITGIMLALARVAGETAPLLFTALGSRFLTVNPNEPFPSLTVQIFNYATQPNKAQNALAWAGILVLIAMIFVLNLLIRYFARSAAQDAHKEFAMPFQTSFVTTEARPVAEPRKLPPVITPSAPAAPAAPLAPSVLPIAPRQEDQTMQLSVEEIGEAEIHEEIGAEEHVLSTRLFSLWYGRRQALFDINMDIAVGKVTAMIGPSGCGKLTLLRSINRLNDLIDHVRVAGNIYFTGQPIYARNVDVITLRKRLGMVFQKSNPFPTSVFENVVYALRIAGAKRSELTDVCERSLRGAGLWDEVKDRLHASALALSGGQQQRLCIARAIAADPDVLLMDEPCSASIRRPPGASKN